ncbi:MAG: hypothetical protein AAGI68_12600 [Planctomycetota bacterium]
MMKPAIALGFVLMLLSLVWGSLAHTFEQPPEGGPAAGSDGRPGAVGPHVVASPDGDHHACPHCSGHH